jgi:large subunit ribosomal protein L4
MKLNVHKIDGTKTDETVELSSSIFEIEPNEHAIYLAVKAYLAHQRQGTSKSKERSEVSGGGKKPWRQKGRGTARAGSSRSPLWVGGGTVFGPRPHLYTIKVPKKVGRLAKCSAYSLKAKENKIIVVEDFTLAEIKTKKMIDILRNLSLDSKKTLLLLSNYDQNLYKSGRNIEKLFIVQAKLASIFDIVNNDTLLIQKSALEEIISNYTKN